MAVTNDDLERLRIEFETKINRVNVENVSMAQAIGSYGERFTAVDAQFAVVDARFDAVDMRMDALAADMDRRFADMDRRFADVRADVARVDTKIDGVEQRLDAKIDGVERRLESRIDKLDDKFDRRFNWQTVMFAALGFITLFSDGIRAAIGV